jgi:tetratricopeptide (TPR) repeat protein
VRSNSIQATIKASSGRYWWLAGLALWGLLVAVYALYAPAFNAPWQFDDRPNLEGLSKIRDGTTAIEFVFGGIASSLGRPLALAGFLPNLADWPSDPSAFRHVNVLLHLLNGLLVMWLALRISRLRSGSLAASPWPVLVLTALWLLHPFLASTSLMVVQRMTLLAATLTLSGLLAFVHGREVLVRSPRAGYLWMSGGLVLGAGIGVLAKENAALLPFFAAALSFTVLAHLPAGNQRVWRTWQLIFFGGPATLLVAYTALKWTPNLHSYAFRPFSLEERLWTQPAILWDYVRQILVPKISLMGPFQDDASIENGLSLRSSIAIIGWVTAIGAAWQARKRLPWLSFALLWFLAGHLLESTIFNLELYYEHRNYLPSLGPLAALVAGAWSARSLWPKAAVSGAVLVAGLLLWQVTTLWGQPRLAAERWASEHPRSSRAVTFLAQRYVLQGDEWTAFRLIEKGVQAKPEDSGLVLQSLQLGCGMLEANEFRERLDRIIVRTPTLQTNYAAVDAANKLRIQLEDGACDGLSRRGLERLVSALIENPRIGASPVMRHHLHHQLAEIYTAEGNLDGAVRNLQSAFDARPNPETAQLLAATLASAGLYEEAAASLEAALQKAPNFAPRRRRWETALDALNLALDQYASSDQRRTSGP